MYLWETGGVGMMGSPFNAFKSFVLMVGEGRNILYDGKWTKIASFDIVL